MTRGQPHLGRPPHDLRGFPWRALTPARRLWRIHRAGNGPWWFCSDLEHRFDLAEPLGTCHLADDRLGSLLEVFTDVRGVAEDEIHARRLSELHLPGRVRLADTTSPRARGFGCTGEIHTTVDYELTQAWAGAFAEAGFDGVRSFVRHDPSFELVGVALFGEAGEASGLPEPITDEIPPTVLADAARRYGVLVLPTP